MKTILVTPSYGPDLERCRLLVDSVQKFATGIDQHILVVDRNDEAVFQNLKRPNVELVLKEDLLPSWVRQISLSKRWWWSNRTLPVRGWIMQQVVKLAIAEHFSADIILFADSDMLFIRPFDTNTLIRQGENDETLVRLYRDERKPHFYKDWRYKNWYRYAANTLGLPKDTEMNGAYICQLASWHRPVVLQLLQHLEQLHQKPWQQAIIQSMDVSEYVLYGVFVENLLQGASSHFYGSELLCHSSWYYDINDKASLSHYLSSAGLEKVAVHLQSNLGFNVEDYAAQLPARHP